ncbi:MAG: class I SAM-dependent methyltransferase [Acidobacteria bacterium]|nr:class I SAM-dependent methyltransferase [Acidobacteriota bacterium]
MAGGTPHWFENWFNEDYLALYRHRDMADANRQISLILSALQPMPSARILDLGCGEGRHSEILHRHGLNVTGIDLSAVLIERGKVQFPHLNLAVGDMRHIPGKFDIILSLFTSFGYFDEDSENMAVLRSVSQALNPGGIYWLDYLNPGYVKASLEPETVREPSPGQRVIEKRRIVGDMVIKDIVFESNNGGKRYQERVKLYDKKQLEEMLEDAGLIPTGSFGDYEGAQWSAESSRSILFARKSNG